MTLLSDYELDRVKKVSIHPQLLYLRPRWHEQQYFAQLEALDMVNCMITPLFFATTLERWPRSFLAGVYCLVLALKGYQMALLMLPAARAVHAHRKARYWLIFAERALRQFVATPALGRGPRFVQWLRDTTAADPGALTAFKLTMLVSGVTHAAWNAFCLPLDFISQVFFNVVFFLLHFPPIVTQVAYSVGMMVKHRPQLVWLQWGLEGAASSAARLLRQRWFTAAAAAASTATSGACAADSPAASAAAAAAVWQVQGSNPTEAVSAAAAAVALPPRCAPDLETLAGRLVLALSAGLMLLLVLYLPLLCTWRVERHLKSSYALAVVREGSARTADSPNSILGSTDSSSSGCGQHPLQLSPLLPACKRDMLVHGVAAAAVCWLLGELFVWLCMVSPLVKLLWRQIPEC